MSITITTKIDIINRKVPPVINLSQYDSDFTLVFLLYASTGVFVVDDSTTAVIRGTKTSGNGYSASGVLSTISIAGISYTSVTITGDAQLTASAGKNIFEITLSKNGKDLSSANFIINVERAPLDADTITDETVLMNLDAIIESAESARQSAESARQSAESIDFGLDAVPTQGSNNAVSSGGVYTELTGLKEDISNIASFSANMLDPTNTESGTINSSGELVANSSYHRSTVYIPVSPSTKYATKNLSVVAEYTADKTFIQRPYVSETTVFTTPNNCYYVKCVGTADVSTWRMNQGETVDDTPYGQITINSDLNYTEVLKNTSVPYNTTYPAVSGRVSLSGGWIGENSKRVRSPIIDIVDDAFNDYLVFFVTSGITLVYKVCALYKDGVFVKNMSSALYNASGTVLALDGTFNQFAIAFAKSDESDFTSSEIEGISITTTVNIALSTVKKDTDDNTKRIGVIENNEQYETLIWKGKKYCALGDSITWGFAPRNYDLYGHQIDSYAKLTAQRLGMTFVNYGVVGSTIAYHAERNPMSVRYANMDNDADLITVMGGTNDIRNGISLGEMSDRTNTTFYGALHVLLGGLYKKYFIDQGIEVGKTKKVVVCTPLKLLDESASELGGTGTLVDFDAWIEAIKEVSAFYSFPVLDFYNLSGINPHLNETVQGTETGYTGVYNPYITDGTHPTQEGQQIMSDLLVGFLKTII